MDSLGLINPLTELCIRLGPVQKHISMYSKPHKVGNRIRPNSAAGFPIHDSSGLKLLGFQLLGFYCMSFGSRAIFRSPI